MTVGKLAALAAIVCAVVVLATVVVLNLGDEPAEKVADEPHATEDKVKADLSRPAYAYLTQTELVVMRGERRLAHVPRVFDIADSRRNQVVWTHSGTYVAFLHGAQILGDEPREEKLDFVDTRTGESYSVACPNCTWIAAVADDHVLAAHNSGADLLEFDLTRPKNAPRTTKNTVLDGEFPNLFLASSRHHLLMAEQTSLRNNEYAEMVSLVATGDATPVNVGFYESNSYMPAAALSGRDPSGDRFAFAARNNPGMCATAFPVYVVTPDGTATETDMSAAVPPGFVANNTNGVDVQDLWWSEDGVLHATIESWTCDESKRDEQSKKTVHGPASLWKLTGNSWAQENTKQATVARRLSGKSVITLRIPECIGEVPQHADATYCNTGSLDLTEDDRTTHVADGVLAVHTAPATTDAQAPAGTPTADTNRLMTAPVPSLCDHPGGNLVDGEVPGIPESDGFVALAVTMEPESAADVVATADLTGDGEPDTVAVFACSWGGVSWPHNLVLWDHDLNVQGAIDLGDVTPAEHADVQYIRTESGTVVARWRSYEGAGYCEKAWTAHLTWNGTALELADLTQVGATGPGC